MIMRAESNGLSDSSGLDPPSAVITAPIAGLDDFGIMNARKFAGILSVGEHQKILTAAVPEFDRRRGG